MNNVENLVIDSDPKINVSKLTLETEFCIDAEQEISISINNSIILSTEDIASIDNSYIKLSDDIELNNNDAVVVIYNKI